MKSLEAVESSVKSSGATPVHPVAPGCHSNSTGSIKHYNTRSDADMDGAEVGVVSCFDFRPRVTSLDSHQIATSKLSKILSIFRSRSDHTGAGSAEAGSPAAGVGAGGCKPVKPDHHGSASSIQKVTTSQSVSSTSQCHGGSKRRFVRVVRDAHAPPPEQLDSNPHTISRYTQKYLETYYNSKPPLSSSPSSYSPYASNDPLWSPDEHTPRTIPYVTSGQHTILKKSSGDHLLTSVSGGGSGNGEASPGVTGATGLKHATFFADVTVIEYSRDDKAETPLHCTRIDPLHDDDEDDYDQLYSTTNTASGLPSKEHGKGTSEISTTTICVTGTVNDSGSVDDLAKAFSNTSLSIHEGTTSTGGDICTTPSGDVCSTPSTHTVPGGAGDAGEGEVHHIVGQSGGSSGEATKVVGGEMLNIFSSLVSPDVPDGVKGEGAEHVPTSGSTKRVRLEQVITAATANDELVTASVT